MPSHLHLIVGAKENNLSAVVGNFKIKYIHNNPVEKGLVSRPEDYYYSSAWDYAGMKGPVKVSHIELHYLFYI